MDLNHSSAVVTGGASGLGKATVEALLGRGCQVVIADLPESNGEKVARALGENAKFVAADVTDGTALAHAFSTAADMAPYRILVHCAGRGGTVRLVEKSGEPGSLELYEELVRVNLVGTFNALRLAAAQMAREETTSGDRGVCILTASVAAFEGQIGQIPYASAKAGVVGMTLVAARDLAKRSIRVCSIAPGVFDTPILDRFGPEVKAALGAATPYPNRLGKPEEYAQMALSIIDNSMLNGETIRLDGAIRMAPK